MAQELIKCSFPKCTESASVKVSYPAPEEPSELCKIHFEIEDPDIKGKYYQIGSVKTEVLN